MTVTAQLDNSSGTPVNLPDMKSPDGFEEIVEYRMVDTEMADGTVSTDIVSASAKRRFTLRWHMLTDANKATLTTLWAGLAGDTGRTFKPPNYDTNGNVSYEVTRDIGQYALEFRGHMTADGFRWITEMRLRQV